MPITFIFVSMQRLCLTFLLISLSFRAWSQYSNDEETKVFSGGPIVGINFAQVDGDDCYGYYKVGLNAGGVVSIRLSQKAGMSMELLYVQKGARCHKVVSSPLYGEYISKYALSLDYVEVPIVGHYMLSPWHRISVTAGGSFAYLLRSKEEVISEIPVWINPEVHRMNNIDVNLILGFKAQVYKKLYSDLRFQYSLISVRPMERIPTGYGYGNQGQFNNSISLRLMYLF